MPSPAAGEGAAGAGGRCTCDVEFRAVDIDNKEYVVTLTVDRTQKLSETLSTWAKMFKIPPSVVGLEDAGESMDLEGSPESLGWGDFASVQAVPLDESWSEDRTEASVREPAPAPVSRKRLRDHNLQVSGGSMPEGNDPIEFVAPNPKRLGSTASSRYEQYMAARTVAEALRLGACKADVSHDWKKGYLLRTRPGTATHE